MVGNKRQVINTNSFSRAYTQCEDQKHELCRQGAQACAAPTAVPDLLKRIAQHKQLSLNQGDAGPDLLEAHRTAQAVELEPRGRENTILSTNTFLIRHTLSHKLSKFTAKTLLISTHLRRKLWGLFVLVTEDYILILLLLCIIQVKRFFFRILYLGTA